MASMMARDMLGSRLISPFFSRPLEMAHHAVRRTDLEMRANFANRWPIAAMADLLANELVNVSLPCGQLFEIRHADRAQEG